MRDFNEVSLKTLEVFEKKSKKIDKISAEVNWYETIPKNIKTHTPKLISKDLDKGSYMLERIRGITFSELLVSQSLSEDSFIKLLDIIHDIHSCPVSEDISHEDLYSNYLQKLKSRYESYNYSQFPNSESIYNELSQNLIKYQKNNLAIPSCIHGDPVFSNVLINKDNEIKLIDPRGMLNNRITIYGDVFYDYAKILQSLSGYDEIMLSGKVYIDKSKFINIFNERVSSLYGEEFVKIIEDIKDSLLFTLLPLHDNYNCIKYFNLIKV